MKKYANNANLIIRAEALEIDEEAVLNYWSTGFVKSPAPFKEAIVVQYLKEF